MRLGRNPIEKDADAIGSLLKFSASLHSAAAATATSARVTRVPAHLRQNGYAWAVFDAGTTEAEVRKVTLSGDGLSWTGGLTYSHASGDSVIFLDRPVINAAWFGCVADGTTNDTTAIQRARDALLSIVRSNPATGGAIANLGQGVLELPAGDILIQAAGALLQSTYTTRTYGLTIRGQSAGQTQIIYDPASSGPLIYNNDAVLGIHIEGVQFISYDSDSDFIHSYSTGGAQNYTIKDCRFEGDWRRVVDLNASSTNSNSEWRFEHVEFRGDYEKAIYNPAGGTDQAVNFWFYDCTYWATTGTFLSLSKGGHVKIYNMDFSLPSTSISSDTYAIELLGSSHGYGVCHFAMYGGRLELRSDYWKFMRSQWQQGAITMHNVDMSSQALVYTETTIAASFEMVNQHGPQILWQGCSLIGKHEYVYGNQEYEKQPHIKYDGCTWHEHGEPSEAITLTPYSSHTNYGAMPTIVFDHCRFRDGEIGEMFDTGYGWDTSKYGRPGRRVLSLQHSSGSFPYNTQTTSAFLPTGAILTGIHLYALPGAAEGTGATFYVKTGEATPTVLMTVSPASHADGFDSKLSLFWLCDGDTTRNIILEASSDVAVVNANAYCILEYIS